MPSWWDPKKLFRCKPRQSLLLSLWLVISFALLANFRENEASTSPIQSTELSPPFPTNHRFGTSKITSVNDNDDSDCPFRDSPLYRSIFVYPNPHTEAALFAKLRSKNESSSSKFEWPWILQRDKLLKDGSFLLDIDNPALSQFTLDMIVYDLLTTSCLRTDNPDTSKLFFVPFLPSVFRRGGDPHWTLDAVPHTSPYEQAVAEAMTGQSFEKWETVFGLTSEYWRRHEGTDHVVVMPEPLHGLYHPKGKRGFHHYIKTQKQLTAPIVISVELSRTFQEEWYPKCFQKNIVMPYPNMDGRWFNGEWDRKANEFLMQYHQQEPQQPQQQQQPQTPNNRPLWMYYDAGNHGECLKLRRALRTDYDCERQIASSRNEQQLLQSLADSPRHAAFPIGMRLATFCPCPGGDSPSAKRMFDAILAGCIPVILSKDFVWPFSFASSTGSSIQTEPLMNPHDFAIHLEAEQFLQPVYHTTTTTTGSGSMVCQRQAADGETLAEYLRRTVSSADIARLQEGVQKAAKMYSFYDLESARRDTNSNNPLREGMLPTGGAARRLVEELSHRAVTGRTGWGACQQEKTAVLKRYGRKMVLENRC